jgi:hypothetical protein
VGTVSHPSHPQGRDTDPVLGLFRQ